MNNKIQQAINKEKEIESLVNAAKEELCEKVAKADHMKGVTPVSGTVKCVMVSIGTLAQNNHNWSPSTYIPEVQANAVREFVSTAKTAGSFQKKVEEMLETGKIKVKGETVVLNQNTMQILKDYIND